MIVRKLSKEMVSCSHQERLNSVSEIGVELHAQQKCPHSCAPSSYSKGVHLPLQQACWNYVAGSNSKSPWYNQATLRLLVEGWRAAFRRSGLHTTARELQTCTFERPGASNTTKIPRKDTQERKRAKMEAGEGKKKARKFWAFRLRAPPFEPPRCGPDPSGPHSSDPNPWALTFSGSGPPTLRAPHSSGLHLSPSDFYHVGHLFFFCAFLIVSISCHFWFFFFFENFTVFLLFLHFSFFQVGVEGGGGANPNPKLVSSLGRRYPVAATFRIYKFKFYPRNWFF